MTVLGPRRNFENKLEGAQKLQNVSVDETGVTIYTRSAFKPDFFLFLRCRGFIILPSFTHVKYPGV